MSDDDVLTYDKIKKMMDIILQTKPIKPQFTHIVMHPGIRSDFLDKIGVESVSWENVYTENVKIIESPFLTKTIQTKYPKSKKKRIQKKFRKKYSKKVPSDEVIMFDDSKINIPSFNFAKWFDK